MKELNPFSKDEMKKSFDMQESFNESVSESDFPMFESHSFNSLDSSFQSCSKKKISCFS